MKIAGIVAEYNPFHCGHLYHIAETRKQLGADTVVVAVMSGNFVQRGDFAVFNKFARAASAVSVENGADLIVELPAVFAAAPAERFALAAVSLLEACGVVEFLSFGSEAGSMEEICVAAQYLSSAVFNKKIANVMKTEGMSYATSRQKIAEEDLGATARIMLQPNNALAVEYVRAIGRIDAEIVPVTVKRQGAAHDSGSTNGGFASASYIRELLYAGKRDEAREFMPQKSWGIIKGSGAEVVSAKSSDTAMMAQMRRMRISDYAKLPDISEGLEHRIFSAVRDSVSVAEVADRAKTKRYTHARIRRILLAAYLGLTEELAVMPPQYIRVLAIGKRGREVLRMMKTAAKLPVVINTAEVTSLSEDGKRLFQAEALAGDLYALGLKSEKNRLAGGDYRFSPIVVE